MERLREIIVDVVGSDAPMTVRQVFYRVVGLGVITNAESEYRTVVVRQLTKLRLEGILPWSWITDGTGWTHKSVWYGSVEEALDATRRHYRRDYWRDLDEYVEVWLEKDALAGVLFRVTDEWGVPLMVTRGFASLSYVHNVADTIERIAGDAPPAAARLDRTPRRSGAGGGVGSRRGVGARAAPRASRDAPGGGMIPARARSRWSTDAGGGGAAVATW
jgi:hypothetical protein